MSETTKKYRAAGKSLKAVEDWFAKWNAAHDAVRLKVKELGAKSYRYSSAGFRGFIFAGEPPKGWVRVKHTPDCWQPTKRSKVGRELRQWMVTALPWTDPWCGLTADLIGEPVYQDNGGVVGVGVRKCGEAWLIQVPAGHDGPPPPDAIPLKESEYWLMVEAAEAKKAAA